MGNVLDLIQDNPLAGIVEEELWVSDRLLPEKGIVERSVAVGGPEELFQEWEYKYIMN